MTTKLWSKEFGAMLVSNLALASAFYALLPTLPVYLTKSLHFSQGDVGLAVAAFSVSAIIIRPFSGYFMDNYHRLAILLVSLFFMTLIFGSYLFATTVAGMLLLRLAHGAAFGVFTSSAATIVADLLPAGRRGEGIGIFGLTISLAMMIGPLVGLKLLTGHGSTVMFLSILAISLFSFICALGVRVRYKKAVRKKFSFAGLFHMKAIPVSLAMFFVMVVYGALIVFVSIYALEKGFTNITSFFLYFALSIMLSRFFLGKLFDKGYVLLLVTIGLTLIAAGMIWLGLAGSQVQFLLAGMVAGFGFGTLMPTGQAKVNNLVGQAERGAANSTYFVSYDLGIGAGALLVGFMSDKLKLADIYIYSSSLILIAAAIFFIKAIPHYHVHKIET